MTTSQAFDPAEFKRNIGTEWRSAVAGWRKWLEVVEAKDGGKRRSATLVEIAELQPGHRSSAWAAATGSRALPRQVWSL
jgi:hypothetical protein